MKYRRLGNSGLKVSEISLGSWMTYGASTQEDVAISIVEKAYESGINYFDTANVYALGEAERLVGRALSKYPRESYVLASKVFFPMSERANDSGLSRKHIHDQIHGSMKRLGVDYIDLYYCHRFDKDTPLEETLRAMDDLIRQGKILYVGISEWPTEKIEEAMRIADRFLLDRIIVNQNQYNMLNRSIEKAVIPVCESNGIGQVIFSPLAQGVLTGKYSSVKDFPSDSRAADPNSNEHMGRFLQNSIFEKIERLKELAAELNASLSQLALAWVLRLPNVASALTGATKITQLEENIKAVDVNLTEDILKRIESIL
jgi:aryl-alcohol dehydrogenase-like predicted oxidoreductase